ncbi:MAG: sigma-54 dependent transcriptional regulator [Polyangia bacterium]
MRDEDRDESGAERGKRSGDRSAAELFVLGRRSSRTVPFPPEGALYAGLDDDDLLLISPQRPERTLASFVLREDGVRFEPCRSPAASGAVADLEPRLLRSGDSAELAGAHVVARGSFARGGRREVLDAAALRSRLSEEVERSLRYRRPLALLLLAPLQRFSRAAREIVAGVVRAVDVIGETDAGELVVLFPETGGEAVEIPARRLLAALEKAAAAAGAGIALCPADAIEADDLLGGARRAAHLAGRGDLRWFSAAIERIEIGEDRLICADPTMKRTLELVRDLAASDIPVMITGDTGVGKELVASALHEWSPRSSRTMTAVNCAAVAESLLESELFGHEKGAFTGADATRPGLFEACAGGTLLLDEICESSLRVQAGLLRTLETKRVRRVGGVKEKKVDVRVLAATNRDIEAEVEAGRFRRDLYYRLCAARVTVPPLARRPLDVPPLLRHFLTSEGSERPILISDGAMQRLLLHDWPGNARELKNLAGLLLATTGGTRRIEAEDLPRDIGARAAPWLRRESARTDRGRDAASAPAPEQTSPEGGPPPFRDLAEEIRELERSRIEQALRATGGTRNRAAELIGMPLRTFVSKLKQYGLSHIQSGRHRRTRG